MSGVTALVLGGSGEVGKQLVKEIITNNYFSRVILLTRRNLDINSEKVEQKIVDFDKLEDYKEAFKDVQVAYCCLGTTRGKAGAEGFVRVDRDYVITAAQLLKEANCRHFHLVSSTGANKDSCFLYNKTKGETEKEVIEMDFPRLSIYRPSLLLCDRQESRPLEKVAQILVRGFDWRNKISVGTDTVASAMISNTLEAQTQDAQTTEENSSTKAREAKDKVEILENADILRLGID